MFECSSKLLISLLIAKTLSYCTSSRLTSFVWTDSFLKHLGCACQSEIMREILTLHFITSPAANYINKAQLTGIVVEKASASKTDSVLFLNQLADM